MHHILTHPPTFNYGGILQAFALQQTLWQKGYTCDTIDYLAKNRIAARPRTLRSHISNLLCFLSVLAGNRNKQVPGHIVPWFHIPFKKRSMKRFPDVDHQAKNIDVIEYIDPYINVWCPQAHAYHLLEEKGKWTPRYAYNKYGDYADRARALKEKGEEIWWYVCVDPQVPYANYFSCYQGVINRMVSWQQYFNDVDGSLYYRTFGGTITKYKFDIGNGDGVLQYRVDTWGREGYGASWRLYQVRDGFDDFDYLSMTEELLGREAAMNVVKKVTTGMLRFTEDYRVMDAARDELAWLILEAQGK